MTLGKKKEDKDNWNLETVYKVTNSITQFKTVTNSIINKKFI